MSGLMDVHAHFVTADYTAAAQAAGHEFPDGMAAWPSWSLDSQLNDMDRRGIARAVLSISSPGVHFGDDERASELAQKLNDEVATMVASRPDRLAYFASLPLPDVDGAIREARRALGESAALGVIIESNAHGKYLGDATLDPLWAELDACRAVVFVHPTSPAGWEHTALGRPRPMLEFMFDSTRTIVDLVLAGVLDRYPNLRIIVPHSGATLPILSDRIAQFQQLLDPDGSTMQWRDAMRHLWFDMAGTPFPTDVPVLASIAGTERLLYGSDSCWTSAGGIDAQLAAIDAAEPPREAANWRELTTRNARRLFA